MYSTISVSTAESAWNNALDTWQEWSEATFDDRYREAILTLVAGLSVLVGYLAGFAYGWLLLQCMRTISYWLSETVQSVPVLSGWWVAPFVEIAPTQYDESCWREIASAVTADILDYELSWAGDAGALS